MSGLKQIIPAAFTDTTLPFFLPSPGVTGYNYRYNAAVINPKLGTADGGAVPSWPGSGSVTTPLTAAAISGAGNPTYRANSGNPYVEFDGVDDGLGISGFVTDSIHTAILVMRHTGAGGSVPILSGSAWNITRSITLTLTGNTGGAPQVTATANVWHFVAVEINGNSSFVRVDATKSAQSPANVNAPTTVFKVGKDGAFQARVDIAEILLYPTALSDGNLDTIRTALKAAHTGLSMP